MGIARQSNEPKRSLNKQNKDTPNQNIDSKSKTNKHNLTCATWNIRRGLITREKEISNLLLSEDIDLIFLTETDNKNIQKEDNYVIQGYKTILPLFNKSKPKIRIMALVRNEIANQVKIRSDLMSDQFPSIWIEYSDLNKKKH